MPLQKWKLLSKKDASPDTWFPIEFRTYQLPNGKIVEDFSITTIPDVAMVVPVTKDEKIVLVRQYKPGVDEVILEFPAGRTEKHHQNMADTAQHELEEETGINVESVEYFATITPFVTKGTEKVFCYLAVDVEFNSKQKMDPNEEIEVVIVTYKELEQLIYSNELKAASTIAAWSLAKMKFAERFSSWK